MTTFRVTTLQTIACPSCGGAVWKAGRQSGEQRYQCRNPRCRKWFRAPDTNTDGMRYSQRAIGVALQSYFEGLSYRDAARAVATATGGPQPDEATIWRWVQGYSDAVTDAVRELGVKPKTGDEWVADEMQVDVGGHPFWLWNVMDRDSRYLLAVYLSPTRDTRAAGAVLRRAKAAAGRLPKSIRTDGLRSYPLAIRGVFGTGKVAHVKTEGIAAEVNNNLSERLQGTLREREKVLRGLKTRKTAQTFLDGLAFAYNHVRPHEGIKGKTPARAADVELPFTTWVDVVEQVRPVMRRPRAKRPTEEYKQLGRKRGPVKPRETKPPPSQLPMLRRR